jgi:hypothetical protein
MSFKFKIGAVVRKIGDPNSSRLRVIGLLLSDRINVRDLDSHCAQIVEAKDYEEVESSPKIPDY